MRQLSRKNDIRPFEDASSLEFLCEKNECAAFLYTSSNKKRPHNLVLGRTFDGHVFDMVELGVNEESFVSLREIAGPKKALGASPCLIFSGDGWERSPELGRLRNLVLDVFGGRDLTGVSLKGIDHVVCLTSGADGDDRTVYWRTYFVEFKKGAAGSSVPRVSLVPMGPSLDLAVRRVHAPSADLDKEAHRVPKGLKAKKVKNVSHDEFGETVGRIHMERQDFNKLELKKTKAAKEERRAEKKAAAEARAAAGGGKADVGEGESEEEDDEEEEEEEEESDEELDGEEEEDDDDEEEEEEPAAGAKRRR